MNHKIVPSILFSLITLLIGCDNKEDSLKPPSNTYVDFLKNTEWVGVLNGNGYQYPPPCALKFNSDNTITIHAHFNMILNGVLHSPDSIEGSILATDSMPDGRIHVEVNFDLINKQDLYVSDRKKIFILLLSTTLDLVPSEGISVNGTVWRGPLLAGSNSRHAYPDLSTINFGYNSGVSTYTRNGVPARYVSPGGSVEVIEAAYQQKGARVYMFGYDETADNLLIPYFGVMLPSGDKMMISSRNIQARLPNYFSSPTNSYGSPGATPVIHKQ